MIETTYDASVTGDAAPIRLSYVAITAQTAPCGAWPEDLALNTLENRNYYNFGCATQSNLAAQIANPTDLVGPRQMSPIDAEQRGQVIDSWRGTDKGDGGTTIVFN
jgi:pilus assembly protein CpaD